MVNRKYLRWAAVILTAMVLAGWGYFKWLFPYGWSHCCIKGMMFALEEYAGDHEGRYPVGEATPEASLSLLYKGQFIDPYTLRGKTVPEKKVKRILESGALLGPESCGWHYVEGMTQADDARLALLWDKVGLGHDGERTKGGGREVVLVNAGLTYIPGAQWAAFLEEQKHLLENRRARPETLCVATIELPAGKRIEWLLAPYTMKEESLAPGSSSSRTSSGSSLGPNELTWYQKRTETGSITRTLSFSNMVSDPVVVRFSNGIPSLTNLVFKMHQKP